MHVQLSFYETVGRIFFAIIIGGMVGFEREFKNRPAGIKTHILVCIGACVIALIQQEIAVNSLKSALNHPEIAGVIRSDEARLIAQVVSGIGFLGAGTIVTSEHSVKGLTTAASIWTVAGLGIACGMGYYQIASLGTIGSLISLIGINRLINRLPMSKKIEIDYTRKKETQPSIEEYFAKNNIKIVEIDFTCEKTEGKAVYKSIYTVDMPHNVNYSQIVSDLSYLDHIYKIGVRRL